MRIRRATTPALLATTVIASIGLVLPVSAASTSTAAVPDCKINPYPDTGTAKAGGVHCFSGRYRARVYCTNELRGTTTIYQGPLRNAPEESLVKCPLDGSLQEIIEKPYARTIVVA